MKDCDTSSHLVVPIGATLVTFLITFLTATISCTIVNIKLLKDNIQCHLKRQLKSIPRQRSDRMETELNTEYYVIEEVDMCQASTSTDFDINSNPACSTVKNL